MRLDSLNDHDHYCCGEMFLRSIKQLLLASHSSWRHLFTRIAFLLSLLYLGKMLARITLFVWISEIDSLSCKFFWRVIASQIVRSNLNDNLSRISFDFRNHIRLHVLYFCSTKCLTTAFFFSSDNFQKQSCGGVL